jgi:RHS repeat-associated protein
MDQGSTQLPAAGISTSYTQVLVESANGTVTRTYLPGLQVIAQKVNGSGAVAIPGDATGDGSVDAFDLNVMASHWQAPTTGTDAEKFAQGDFNLDGMVDAFDLNVLAANWGKSGTGLQVLLADGGGSTRVLSGAGGGTLETYGYDAYGTLIPGGDGGYGLGHAWVTNGQYSTPATSYLYRNQQMDRNGLYNLRARYYDPRQGRFISKDPYRPDAYNTLDRNGYLYVAGDPINRSDPEGLATAPTTRPGSNVSYQVYALLNEQMRIHQKEPYFEAAGVNSYFEQLRKAASNVKYVVKPMTGDAAQYHPPTGTVRLDPSFNSHPDDVMHELVHALDHQSGWFVKSTVLLTSVYPAEAIAEGSVRLLAHAQPLRLVLQAESAEQAERAWLNAWNSLNRTKDEGTSSYKIEGGVAEVGEYGMKLISEKLLHFSHAKLKPIYEQELRKKGIDACLLPPRDLIEPLR